MALRTLPSVLLPLLLLLVSVTLNAQHAHPHPEDVGFTSEADGQQCGFDDWKAEQIRLNPDFERWYENYKAHVIPRLEAQQYNATERGPNTLYVPVVFHVIHNAGETVGQGQNLTLETIQGQLETMNEDFGAYNDDFNSTPDRWKSAVGNPDIQFCLVSIDPDGNPSDGVTRDVFRVTGTTRQNSNIESEIKPATIWDPKKYFNVWTLPIPGTTAGGGVTGYATFPTVGVSNGNTDGAVVDYRWCGPGATTMTHEAGHYFGLPHTFDGTSCSADDGISDTPNMGNNTNAVRRFNCNGGYPTGPITCGNEHMYINYMDYSPGSCVNSFTNGQIAIMRGVLTGNPVSPQPRYSFESRASLVTNSLAACTFYDNDASIAEIQTPAAYNCADLAELVPNVRLTNFGFIQLTTVKIGYRVNNGPEVTFNYNTVLESGESELVPLTGFVTPPPGTHEIQVYTYEPNGMQDEQPLNDTLSILFSTLGKQPFGNALFEDFTSGNNNPDPLSDLPSNMFDFNPNNDEFGWEWHFMSNPFPILSGCARFKNYVEPQDGNGRLDRKYYLSTPNYDFTNITGAKIAFDVSYAPWADPSGDPDLIRADTLFVMVSTDCAASFTDVVYASGGVDLATSPAVNAEYLPTSSLQWKNVEVDLSAYSGLGNVTIALVNQSGHGNYLYLDNINLVHDNSCFISAFPPFGQNDCADACEGTGTVAGVSGGTPPYSYLWPPDAGSQTTATATDLCAGSYVVTVTDGGGCTREVTGLIISNPPLDAVISITNATCGASDGAIVATGRGGSNDFSFFFNNRFQGNMLNVTGLPAGNYEFILEDFQYLCRDTFEFEILDDGDTETSTDGTPVDCFGALTGTATVTPMGSSTSYTYLWDDPAGQETATATGLAAGTYTVTVTDDNDCATTDTYIVLGPDEILLQTSAMATGCGSVPTGTATVQATGGIVIDSYGYLWNDPAGQTTATATGLAAGMYTVTVTDDQNCSATAMVTVGGGAEITLVGSSTPAECNGLDDGTATVLASGGTVSGDYTYLWSDPAGQSTATATGLRAGTYTVTVTDDNDCEEVETIMVNEPDEIIVSTVSTDPACFGEASGTATASATGGTVSSDYTYLWSDGDGQTTAMATGLIAGSYTVTVTDDNDCTKTRTVQIDEPDELTVSITPGSVSCNGLADGTATANAGGGTVSVDYTYLWDDPLGQTTATATGLTAGTYSVTVTDDNNCSKIESIEIGEPVEMDLAVITRVNLLCNGDNSGSIEVEGTGGTAPLTYSWNDDPARTTALATGLGAGTYIVTVKDANNCEAEEVVVLTEPDALDLTVTKTDVTFVGGSDGTATADINGGTPGYTYLWNDPAAQVTAMATGLTPGTYCVTVTDANNCETEGCTTVNGVNCPDIEIDFDPVNVSCFEGNDGRVTATPTGGATPYTYKWSDIDGQESATATALPAGTYSVTVTDANGCESIDEVTISEPNELLANASATDESLAGANDGTATANPTGGTPPYTYNWGTFGTNQTIMGLAPGLYTVTVTDANDCTREQTVEVLSGDIDCTTFEVEVSTSDAFCFGSSDGTATATASGGTGTGTYTYLWDDPATQTTATATGLTAGTYIVIVKDANNCEIERMVTISEPDELSANASATAESLAGANDGTATANPTGGTPPYTYNWGSFGTTQTIMGLAPGMYTVTVTDANDCTSEETVEVLAGDVDCTTLEVEVSSTNALCFGSADGTATAIANGGTGAGTYTYRWNDTDAQTTATATGLTAGTYIVIVTDANNCEVEREVTIGQPDELLANASATAESTAGANDGTATANPTGGTPPYTYNWGSFGTTQTIMGLAPGMYTVTVTDANDCTSEETVEVLAGDVDCTTLEVEVSSTNALCFGSADGTATAIANGGTGAGTYTYLWNDTDAQTTATATGLTAGTYIVIVTDANNCEVEREVTIGQPDELLANASATAESTAGANDGTATANPTGGTPPYTYNWGSFGTTQTIMGLAPGMYTVTVTDANDCTSEETVEVLSGDVDCTTLEVEVSSTNALCFGSADGTATAIANGGTGAGTYTYLWNDTDAQTTATATGLTAGTYIVIVTDANNCEVERMVTIGQPDELLANASATAESAAGASDGTATANPTGGTPPYTYNWGSFGTTQTIMGLAPGMYTVTVMDANDCTSEETVEVLSGDVDCTTLEVEVTSSDALCFGNADGEATATASGGTGAGTYTYLWNDAGAQTTATATGLPAGTYIVIVTDANNCEVEEMVTIGEPDELTVNISGTDESAPGAFDGTARAIPSGGTLPYTIVWDNAETDFSIDELAPGTYCATIVDANGCEVEDCVTINEGGCETPTVEFSTIDVNCFEGADGFATALVIGSNGPYSFLWSNGQMLQTATGLTAGIHIVTITDNSGCETVAEVEINQPATAVSVNMSSTAESALGSGDGTATAMGEGGTPGYVYDWGSFGNGPMITGLGAGIYVVTVTDANGCTAEGEVEVEAGMADCSTLEAEVSGTDALCNGESNGTATANPSGGDGNYTYEWSNGQDSQTATGLPAGTARVTITDGNNCMIIEEVNIGQPSVLQLTGSSTPESFAGATDGTATVNPDGGVAPYSYDWGAFGNTQTITGLAAGTYPVTVTDGNGCMETVDVIVEEGMADCSDFSIEVIGENVSCVGDEDGTASVLTTGGEFPFTYSWSNSETNGTIFGLEPGTYQVTVVDVRGCRLEGEVTIGEPEALTATATKTDETVNGANDGTATANPEGGTSPYEYEWSGGAGTDKTVDNLAPGIYTVTITDANGCTTTTEVEVLEGGVDCTSFELLVASTSDVSCFGDEDGLANLEVTGGQTPYRINWDIGGNQLTKNDLAAGTYRVTATDGNNCIRIVEFTISEPDLISLTIDGEDETVAGLNDGKASVLANGGVLPYSYVWSNNETTPTIENLSPDIYSVTITDANGCTAVAETTVALGEPDCSGFSVNLVETTGVSCPGGSDGTAMVAVVGNQGNYTIAWSTGDNTEMVTGLGGGLVRVVVTDDLGCETELEITIEEPDAFLLNMIGTDGNCGSKASARANISGGTAPYIYAWSNGDDTQSTRNLDAGNYEVTITDANGCETTGDVTVTVEAGGLRVNGETTDVSCFGESDGRIDLDITEGTAPFTITWGNGESTTSLTDLPAGNFVVQIVDADGCSFITSYVINEPPELTVNFQAVKPTTPTSNNGSLTAYANGGVTPYTYNWSNGENTQQITGLVEAIYYLTIVDGYGCEKVDSFDLSKDLVGLQDLNKLSLFELYPNPSSGETNVNLEFSEAVSYQLEVFNLIGQRVYTLADRNQKVKHQLQLNGMAAGTYLVRVRTEKGQAVKKLVLLE